MRYYGPEEIRAALEPRELVSVLRSHLAAPHKSSPRTVLTVGQKAIGSMLSATPHLLGGKIVCVFPENTRRGLNPHQGLVALFSPLDGKPTALFDACEITGFRTAALSALATEALSAPETETLAIFGTGLQAYLHAKLVSGVRPIKKIRVHGRNPGKARALGSRLERELGIECLPQAHPPLQEKAILCLCTSATTPYLREEEIPPGSHVNAVGACRPGMGEIRLRTPSQLEIYVDDLDRIKEEASELEGQANLRLITQAFSPREPAPPPAGTLFKSVGTGLLDIVTADLVRRKLP